MGVGLRVDWGLSAFGVCALSCLSCALVTRLLAVTRFLSPSLTHNCTTTAPHPHPRPPHPRYAPIPSSSLARLSECKEQLVDLLHSIPGMFTNTVHGPESCGAAAIEVNPAALIWFGLAWGLSPVGWQRQRGRGALLHLSCPGLFEMHRQLQQPQHTHAHTHRRRV